MGTRMITLRAGAQTEFQVEAMIGYIADSGPFSDRSPENILKDKQAAGAILKQ